MFRLPPPPPAAMVWVVLAEFTFDLKRPLGISPAGGVILLPQGLESYPELVPYMEGSHPPFNRTPAQVREIYRLYSTGVAERMTWSEEHVTYWHDWPWDLSCDFRGDGKTVLTLVGFIAVPQHYRNYIHRT